MFAESISVALTVSMMGAVISLLVASMIKGLYLSIKLRQNVAPKIQQYRNRSFLATKPLSH